jgi:putative FmdB family regulatory protein
MPIYEFYCGDCHAVFSFLARLPNTRKRPACPRCGRPRLERQPSRFAVSRGRPESTGEDESELPDVDEARMERAMAELAGEAEKLDEDDPRQMARLMRKLYDSTGLQFGEGMEEALRRLERGDDPDRIEQELGDLLEGEEPVLGSRGEGLRALRRRLVPPERDETLYEM